MLLRDDLVQARRRYRLTRVLGTTWAFTSLGLDPGALTTWTDDSGNSEDVTESTNPPTATDEILGLHPGVEFTSPDTLAFSSTVTAGAEFSLILLGDVATLGTNSTLVEGTTDGVTITAAGEVSLTVAGSSATLSSGAGITVDTPALIEIRRAADDDITCVVDGINVLTGTPSLAGDFSLDALGNASLTGSLYHAQLVERFISSTEGNRLRRLFIRRYGLVTVTKGAAG